ncbi:unnamed protein product [Urochloa humidicola]
MNYLGINEGRQNCLVVAWSATDGNKNRYAATIRVVQRLIEGIRNKWLAVADFRIFIDPHRIFGFILCPDPATAEHLRGCYVDVGKESIFIDLVGSVKMLPSNPDGHSIVKDHIFMTHDNMAILDLNEGDHE